MEMNPSCIKLWSEQRLNLNCLHMNLSSVQAEFKFLEYGNLKLKANTWNWMWQLLKFTNLPTITVKFIFKCLSFRLSSERLNIWKKPLFPEWLEDSCLLQSCWWLFDTHYLANCKPCGTVPFSSTANEQAFFSLSERDTNCILQLLILWRTEHSFGFMLYPAFILQVHVFVFFGGLLSRLSSKVAYSHVQPNKCTKGLISSMKSLTHCS